MSNVIDFLERMGQDARLRHATGAEVELALESEELDPELRVAILAKNRESLETLLAGSTVCCLMFPAEEEDGDSDESPSRDDEEVTSLVLRAMAQ